MIKGLVHIGVFITDIERSKKFYGEILGFTLDTTHELPGAHIAIMSAGTCILELVEIVGEAQYPEGVVNHIAMEVEDLAQAMKELAAKGIKFDTAEPVVDEKMCGGVTYIFFRGPDNEKIEILQYL